MLYSGPSAPNLVRLPDGAESGGRDPGERGLERLQKATEYSGGFGGWSIAAMGGGGVGKDRRRRPHKRPQVQPKRGLSGVRNGEQP